MDDYYELLDVAPDSDRDDIRTAYRAKRDELQSQEGDGTRAKVAELNRAWNVLSDPAQRERYDERLAEHRESDDVDEYDDDDDDEDDNDGDSRSRSRSRSSSGSRSRSSSKPTSKAEERAAARAAARRTPTIVLPAGLKLASPKARGLALLFDIMVLLLVFFAGQSLGVKVIDHRFPGQQHEYNALVKKYDTTNKLVSDDGKKESTANKQATTAATKHDTAAQQTAKSVAATASAKKLKDTKTRDAYKKQADVILSRLRPTRFAIFVVTLLVALLYVVPLTALTGQTVGMRLRKTRVVRLDGSVPGWKTSLIRFGVPAMIATILWSFLAELSLAVVMLGMIGWINNPNKQGLHDRLAKTVVVEA